MPVRSLHRLCTWHRSQPMVGWTLRSTLASFAAAAAAAQAPEIVSPAQQAKAYPFPEIEKKWQGYWEDNKTFRTPDMATLDMSKPKHYVLDMFPYPRHVLCRGAMHALCRQWRSAN